MISKDALACGASIPFGNPHAISVQLPTMEDVIGYEEQNAALLNKLESAYPRFRTNRYVADVCNLLRTKNKIDDAKEIIPISSTRVLKFLPEIGCPSFEHIADKGMDFLLLDKSGTCNDSLKSFLQHTGMIPSSRKAEDYLLAAGYLTSEFAEDKLTNGSTFHTIKSVLSDAYGAGSPDNVFLMNCGMNAVFSAFESLRQSKARQNKNIFVQLGWIYLDSMEILRKYAGSCHRHFDLLNLEPLYRFIEEHQTEIAAVFTEIPTNPLIQTVDLPALSAILRKFDIPLVVDSSIGTPFTMDIMPYTDVIIESMTKFAGGNTDIMMGAVILNNKSGHAEGIRDILEANSQPPYEKDARRLAQEIKGYEARVRKISENASVLIEYLRKSKKVKHLYSAIDGISGENFKKIARPGGLIPGLVSIVFDQELKYYYDRLPILKGPSFGSEFSLGMAYVYLAHYKMLRTPEGRKELADLGIEPELLRLSIGIEPPELFIGMLESIN